jgi:hypothetical protein
MADARSAWNETGDKINDLGRKLKVHYDTQHGAEGEQSREELKDAARRLGSAVQDAFEAIGAAARDKAVQDDVKRVGQSLAEALTATLGQAATEVRRAVSERKGQASAAPAEPAAPTEPATPAEPAAPTAPAASAEPGTPGDGEAPPKVEPWGTP